MPLTPAQKVDAAKVLRALAALRACRDELQARGQHESAYQVGVLIQLPSGSLATLSDAFEHASEATSARKVAA